MGETKSVPSGPQEDQKTRLAPFNPTCSHAQNIAMDLLELTSEDVLFDLGCGDGRFLLAAADKHSLLRCVGIEIDPVYAQRGKEAVEQSSLDVMNRVDIREGDVMDELGSADSTYNGDEVSKPLSQLSLLDDATAMFLYLLPKGLQMIKPFLEEAMRRRANESKKFKVASYMFSIRGWKPVKVDRSTKGDCPVYLYDSTSFTEVASD
mmetsp:Transcript_18579/g.26231  ORF Transcript_18579/g.26231 Transcript_18579/m.26231 type:complete len:207 (-) Transcript_18579:119-739(-)